MAIVKFSVSAPLTVKGFIAVVGNAPEIGKWGLSGAKILEFDAGSSKWSREIEFETTGLVKYRYFSGIFAQDENGTKKLVIRQWEAGVMSEARSVDATAGGRIETSEDFGVINGKNTLQRGMLSGQSEIRFNISNTGDKPIVSWREQRHETLQIKFEMDMAPLEVQGKLIKEYEFVNLRPENWTNLPAKEAEVLTYVAGVSSLKQFFGHFTISDSSCKILGRATIAGQQLHKSIGHLSLAILDGDGKGVGGLNLEYVVIKSYKSEEISMRESFAAHWKKKSTIHVGHRGAGNSFTADKPSDIFENTITGFKAAAMHGAEMVEFDVQLTKDGLPIVFHDFTICTSVASKNDDGKFLLHEVEVQSLSYDELMEYKMRHRFRKNSERVPSFDEDDSHPHNRPFPTLQEVLEGVPKDCGFDVELKWPHYFVDKSWYHNVSDFGDANDFLDRILDVVFKYAGNRRIVFSCFDADICTMLQRKQHLYPVIFLACEADQFMELRSRFNSLAVPFSASERFLGFCTEEASAYSDPELAMKVHNAGLLYFLYGDNVGEPENRAILTKQGADGIIFDRIHQVLPKASDIQETSNTH